MCVNCIYWVSNKELVAEMWKVISNWNWLLLADISSVEQRTGHLSGRTCTSGYLP